MAEANATNHDESSSPNRDQGIVQVDEEILACPVCYEYYNGLGQKPCVLPDCGHIVCSTCAAALWEYKRIRCPKCRKLIDVEVLADLPINHGVLDITKGFSQKKNLKDHHEQMNHLLDAKVIAAHRFDEFCKNLAVTQDSLLKRSIESLQQTQSLFAEFANVSEVYQSGLQSLNNLQRMKTKADYKHVEQKLAFVKTLLGSLDCLQFNNNCLNGSNIPSMQVVMDGRLSGELTLESGILHLYCFAESEESKDIAVLMANVERLYLSKDIITAFLDVTQGADVLGRIYIDLSGHRKYTQQFVSMCLGVHGPSYKGMEFTASMGREQNFLSTGIYVNREGEKSSEPPGEALSKEEFPQTCVQEGFIVPRIDATAKISTRFLLFLKALSTTMPCAGKVKAGMDVVHKIIEALQSGKAVSVSNCGIVLDERKEE